VKILILIVTIIGALFFVYGWHVERTGRSADERVGAVLPYLIGGLVLLFDVTMIIVWGFTQ
jgi:hypothetical protein